MDSIANECLLKEKMTILDNLIRKGFSLQSFLTVKRLRSLYNKAVSAEMQFLTSFLYCCQVNYISFTVARVGHILKQT
jgi:hypothetical protein